MVFERRTSSLPQGHPHLYITSEYGMSLTLEASLIEISAAVAQVSHATIGVEFRQLVQVDIGNKYHLRVWCSLGTPPVIRELEVAWRKDRRLRVLNVHIPDPWEVLHQKVFCL